MMGSGTVTCPSGSLGMDDLSCRRSSCDEDGVSQAEGSWGSGAGSKGTPLVAIRQALKRPVPIGRADRLPTARRELLLL